MHLSTDKVRALRTPPEIGLNRFIVVGSKRFCVRPTPGVKDFLESKASFRSIGSRSRPSAIPREFCDINARVAKNCGSGDRIVWLHKADKKLTVLSSEILCHMEVTLYV